MNLTEDLLLKYIDRLRGEQEKPTLLLCVRVRSSLESEADFTRHREAFARKRKRDLQKRAALADYGGKTITPPPKGGKFA